MSSRSRRREYWRSLIEPVDRVLALDERALRLVQPGEGPVEVEAVLVVERRDDARDLGGRRGGRPAENRRDDPHPRERFRERLVDGRRSRIRPAR
jgi:hypothetical protein